MQRKKALKNDLKKIYYKNKTIINKAGIVSKINYLDLINAK